MSLDRLVVVRASEAAITMAANLGLRMLPPVAEALSAWGAGAADPIN